VWTVVDDTIEHVEATRDLDKWRRFMDARRRWVAHRIDSRSTTEFVCDAVAEALSMVRARLYGGRCAKCGTCLLSSDGDRYGRCAGCVVDEERAREQGAL
jgi:hypothetical protein